MDMDCADCYDIAHDEMDEREACDVHADDDEDASAQSASGFNILAHERFVDSIMPTKKFIIVAGC